MTPTKICKFSNPRRSQSVKHYGGQVKQGKKVCKTTAVQCCVYCYFCEHEMVTTRRKKSYSGDPSSGKRHFLSFLLATSSRTPILAWPPCLNQCNENVFTVCSTMSSSLSLPSSSKTMTSSTEKTAKARAI